ncbi:MAG TPA: ABC transporter substrate-binding protein [Steroidobacteraceae bacterium]|nr:ABC transporter substrate-binding protein [Steroidobacteraceae bacterium]
MRRSTLMARAARCAIARAAPHAIARALLRAMVCCLAFGAPPLAGAAGLPTVTLGVVNWIGYGPIYCAAAKGYYKRYGRDVRLVTFTDNSLMAGALEGGELDATTLTYDQVIVADARGWKLEVVMPVDYSTGGDAILANVGVVSVRDLKGRKVAFQPLSPSDFLLGYALAQAGLSEKDIQPVNATPEGVAGIMASGAVDAGVTYQPNVAMILKLGGGRNYHVLLSSREARGMITDVLVLTASRIAADPRLVDELIRGTLDGLAFMRQQPDQAAAIIARVLEITRADVLAQLPNIENPPLAQLGDVFRHSNALPSFYASGKIIGQILAKQGQIATLPSIDDTYDARFVNALQAQKGALK